MAPDSTAVYGIHVCGPGNFDDDGDQAICVAPGVSRTCSATPIRRRLPQMFVSTQLGPAFLKSSSREALGTPASLVLQKNLARI